MDDVWNAMNQEFINTGENFRIMTSSESKEFQSQIKHFNKPESEVTEFTE